MIKAIGDYVMDHRNGTDAPECYEDHGPVDPIVGQIEFLPQGQDDRQDAEDGYRDHVGEASVVLTVEPIVQPGNDGSDDEDGDPSVVKPRK